MHGTESPSDWVQRWAHLAQKGSTVLDVACGAGRHMRFLAAMGHPVTGVDRHPEALAQARAFGQIVCADIENGPWPFQGQTFACVLVTHYLFRPLWHALLGSVAPGGVLVYETFAAGNETVGKPSRPDFLLQPGELLQVCAGLRVVAYEDGFAQGPDRFVQRVVAVREAGDPRMPLPYRLSGG